MSDHSEPRRYGHFLVSKDGDVTVVTNTDDQPHPFTYDSKTVELTAGETRRFNPPQLA